MGRERVGEIRVKNESENEAREKKRISDDEV